MVGLLTQEVDAAIAELEVGYHLRSLGHWTRLCHRGGRSVQAVRAEACVGPFGASR